MTDEIEVTEEMEEAGAEVIRAVLASYVNPLMGASRIYRAMEKARREAEGWIEWWGGRRPTPEAAMVQVRYRTGALDTGTNPPGRWSWHPSNPEHADIIAYRLIGPEKAIESVQDVPRTMSTVDMRRLLDGFAGCAVVPAYGAGMMVGITSGTVQGLSDELNPQWDAYALQPRTYEHRHPARDKPEMAPAPEYKGPAIGNFSHIRRRMKEIGDE